MDAGDKHPDGRHEALRGSIGRFAERAAALPEDAFLAEVGGRSPRDIVAHLIGWNRATIDGYAAIQQGRLPACLVDPGRDFSHVNGAAIRRYASRDRAALLAELGVSADEFDAFLRALPADEWDNHHGVTWHDRPISVGWFVEALVEDYDHHRAELASWPPPAPA